MKTMKMSKEYCGTANPAGTAGTAATAYEDQS